MFMVFTIVSAILYWLIIGTFSSLVMGIDPSGRIYRQKLDMVNEYLRFNRFPEAIRVKVRRYFRVKYQGKIFQEDLLNDLNRSMLQEIALFNCRGLIEKVDFLRRNKCDGRDELFLTELCMALISGYYIEDEIVFSAGEDGSDMYFIQTGKASVIVKGSVVAEMEDGSFFGEVSLITGAPRTATVKAKTRLLVYKLMQDDFNRILLQFPDVGLHIRETFKARMARLQKQSGAPPEAPPTKAEPPRVSIIETRHRSSVAT
ncbi:cyclic nucleotide-binding-like protein, partial [Polychytrium aggregatum]|uniref:cyclic nucleotide-binding-like protein n=1 Tax=Polychytrium aggregatum TaxID=110093 RepID=UPI0022FE96E9